MSVSRLAPPMMPKQNRWYIELGKCMASHRKEQASRRGGTRVGKKTGGWSQAGGQSKKKKHAGAGTAEQESTTEQRKTQSLNPPSCDGKGGGE